MPLCVSVSFLSLSNVLFVEPNFPMGNRVIVNRVFIGSISFRFVFPFSIKRKNDCIEFFFFFLLSFFLSITTTLPISFFCFFLPFSFDSINCIFSLSSNIPPTPPFETINLCVYIYIFDRLRY